MALIELKNLDKIYNTTAVPVHAVKDVSLLIEKKEFISKNLPVLRKASEEMGALLME